MLLLVVATTASVPDVLEAVGTVRAFETSQLSSQVMGTLAEVRVREGDRLGAARCLQSSMMLLPRRRWNGRMRRNWRQRRSWRLRNPILR